MEIEITDRVHKRGLVSLSACKQLEWGTANCRVGR